MIKKNEIMSLKRKCMELEMLGKNKPYSEKQTSYFLS
jgi:hypothetical protein